MRNKRRRKRDRGLRRELRTLLLLTMCLVGVWFAIIGTDGSSSQELGGQRAASSGLAEAPALAAPEATAAATALRTPAPSPTPTMAPMPTPSPTPTPVPTPAPTPVALDYPYYVEVDRGMQVVRVYTVGEDGRHSLLVRQMICSTDQYDRKPPDGLYVLHGEKIRWLYTVSGTYAQYATRIVAKILFHSVPYTKLSPDGLDADAYELLGTNASIGCVRLLCEDAKWLYERLVPGTAIRFMTGARDEGLLTQLAPPALTDRRWDPTDADEKNPAYDGSRVLPEVTPALGVTPRPTHSWTPASYS